MSICAFRQAANAVRYQESAAHVLAEGLLLSKLDAGHWSLEEMLRQWLSSAWSVEILPVV